MPRKGSPPKREIAPDGVFGSVLVSRFIGTLLRRGKRSKADAVVYGALQHIAARTGKDPLGVLEQALQNVTPQLEVRPRRVGGQTYQVPNEVRPGRRLALGMRWLCDAARNRSGRSMQERLAGELMDAANGAGAAAKKREDTHRMAEANKAFAHYRL